MTSQELLNKYLPSTCLGQEVSVQEPGMVGDMVIHAESHSQCTCMQELLSCPEELRSGGSEWQFNEAAVGSGLTLKAQGRHADP